MKVKELIKELQKIENQDALVILPSDAEGNSFSEFSGDISNNMYWNEEDREIYDSEDFEECESETEKAIILWPN